MPKQFRAPNKNLNLSSVVGITLDGPDGVETIPVPATEARRDILARASQAAIQGDSGDKLVDLLAAEIREGCAVSPLADGDLPWRPFRLSSPKNPEIRGINTEMPEWFGYAVEALLDQGYTLEKVEPKTDFAAFINWSSPVHLFEVVRQEDKKVIGGGKGSSEAAAQLTAVGEAIERIVAADPNAPTFLGSAKQLREIYNLEIPEFDVGPGDAYSENLFTDWVGGQTIDGRAAAIPVERAFYNYWTKSGVSAFSRQHTAGLAAGDCQAAALHAAVLEIMERDAYWLVMRCRMRCPTIPFSSVVHSDSQISRELAAAGIRIVLKDFSLDWPVKIVHAFAIDTTGRLPAFAHGIGSGFHLSEAVNKAIAECLQMRAGLARQCSASMDNVLFSRNTVRAPDIAWSDPASVTDLSHLFEDAHDAFAAPSGIVSPSIEELFSSIGRMTGTIVWAELGTFARLSVVRATIPGALLPYPNVEYVPNRLRRWLDRCRLRYPYEIPILT